VQDAKQSSQPYSKGKKSEKLATVILSEMKSGESIRTVRQIYIFKIEK
jgi:hypothetical protein